MTTREQLIETSNEAASVAWQRAADADGGEAGAQLDEFAKAIAAGLNGVRVAILAAVAEPEPPTINVGAEPPLATWAYVELMGHRVLVGYVEADELAGRGMLRIRRLRRAQRDPGVGEPKPPVEFEEKWKLYSPAAVYSFEPIAEADARERFLAQGGIIDHHDDIPF